MFVVCIQKVIFLFDSFCAQACILFNIDFKSFVYLCYFIIKKKYKRIHSQFQLSQF